LLSLVRKTDPDSPLKIVVVVDGGGAAATAMQARYTGLLDAAWYTDHGRTAWTALKMSGVPMVFAVQDTTIRWSLNGVLTSDDQVKSILAGWAE
jgi:hypothetical protein